MDFGNNGRKLLASKFWSAMGICENACHIIYLFNYICVLCVCFSVIYAVLHYCSSNLLATYMLHPIRKTAHFTKWTYFCPFHELASSLAHFMKWAQITLTLAHFMNWTLIRNE
jgi:hypothetical protein